MFYPPQENAHENIEEKVEMPVTTMLSLSSPPPFFLNFSFTLEKCHRLSEN